MWPGLDSRWTTARLAGVKSEQLKICIRQLINSSPDLTAPSPSRYKIAALASLTVWGEWNSWMESFWYYICRGRSRFCDATVLESLRKAGVKTELCDAHEVNAPGITLLEEITDEAHHFLNEASDHGRRQILAIVPRSALLNSEEVWKLLQAGATDVMAWDELKSPSRDIADRLERWQLVDQVLSSAVVKDNLVGSSRAWTQVVRQCIEVAMFTDSAVLITGESGTGKTLARLIHTLDCRSDKRDLVVLDCTTVVPELSGSEFFGHERVLSPGRSVRAMAPLHLQTGARFFWMNSENCLFGTGSAFARNPRNTSTNGLEAMSGSRQTFAWSVPQTGT